MRILLSDGSGLTARQCATQLVAAGHAVEVLSADRLALTRFTRHVRRVHKVQSYGVDPFGWLEAALGVYSAGGFDILLPTQEQVAVLSCCPDRLQAAGVVTAVPPFRALAKVQDKVSAHATLIEIGLPQPQGAVLTTRDELAAWDSLPVFVKTPIGTATSGVRHVVSRAEMDSLAAELDAADAIAGGGVLVQAPAVGPLVMAQSVFDHGVLVAAHANLRVREGASGGASHKRSLDNPELREHLRALGQELAWHGALSADAILTDDGPLYIDINPRLVEPGNAWQAGVDLVGAMLDVARQASPPVQGPGRPDVATHQLLLAVLGAAQQTGTRRSVVGELASAVAHRGSYHNSVEELTPIEHDLRTLVPLLVAASATLVKPSAWRTFSSGAVASYALTPGAWRRIVDRAPPSDPT